MPRDVLADFVDRGPELARFQRMLRGPADKRILLIIVEGEQGKSCLLQRIFHECERQCPPVLVALLDFDRRKSGLTDYLSVIREIRRYLGDECTPTICACEDEITHAYPLLNIQTGGGGAGVGLGKRNDFTDATLRGIAGRDSIRVGNVSGAALTADQLAHQQDAMGRALGRDLASLSPARVVLLVDTFEHASPETCDWLERWLFQPLRNLPHVSLVVAGRPACRPFFAQTRLWSGLLDIIDRFIPFSEDDIRTHYHQRGISISDVEWPVFVELARPNPMAMAQLGDLLEQARGGGMR